MLLLFRLFLAIHIAMYRLTGGRVGGRMGGDVLLLNTRGRKTGKPRTVPVLYLRDGEKYLVTASAGGDTRHLGWYWNAAHGEHPVTIQVRNQVIPVTVREAKDEQRADYYARFVEMSQQFAHYAQTANREIPILVLTPKS